MTSSTSRSPASDAAVRSLLAPVLVFIACCISREPQLDLWHHLARGRVMVNEGAILDEDRFTYTVAGREFQDVNWLTQLLYYGLHRVGSIELLQVVNALVLATTAGIVVHLARKVSGSTTAASAAGIVFFLGTWQFQAVRPQSFSLLLFAGLLLLLDAVERRPRLLLFVPLFPALWVNVHGSYPIGIVLIGCSLLSAFLEVAWSERWAVVRSARVWRLLACVVVSMIATLANPYGWTVHRYVLLTSGVSGARKIDEWLPPGLGSLAGVVLALSLMMLIVLLACPGRRPGLRWVVLLVVFLPPALGSSRMIAWWMIVVAPVLALLLANVLPASKEDENAPNRGAAITLVALLLASVLSLPWLERVSPYFLVRSTRRFEEHLESGLDVVRAERTSGCIFTRLEWSEYLTWSAGPDFKVFMDGRIEIVPDDVWAEYSLVTSAGTGWEDVLKRYEVEYLLIDRGPYHGRLRPQVEASATWEEIAAFPDFTIHRRVKKK